MADDKDKDQTARNIEIERGNFNEKVGIDVVQGNVDNTTTNVCITTKNVFFSPNDSEKVVEEQQDNLSAEVKRIFNSKFSKSPQDKEFPPNLSEERSKEIQNIVNYLLDENSKKVVVLQGAFGFGKSFLALLTCYRLEIIQHFTGGIFWVDLGKGKNVLQGFRKLYYQLIHTECPPNLDEDNIINKLIDHWEKDKPYLIVLNHIQKKEDFNKFYSSRNDYCSWLVTTPIVSLVDENDSEEPIHIKSLNPDESKLFIENELIKKGKFNKEKLKELVDQLYEWPLLLNLVRKRLNKLLRNNMNTPDEAIDNIIKRLNSRGWIKYFDKEIKENIRITFDALEDNEIEFFKELVIFPEDLPIPLSILKNLWNLDDDYVEDLCEKFYDLSLLTEFNKYYIRLNSYLREYLRQVNKIEARLPEIHAKLIRSYEEKYQVKISQKLSEEFLELLSDEEKDYFRDCYMYHLIRAKLEI